MDGISLLLYLSISDNVLIKLCLNSGDGKATARSCDLREEYVTINSAYAIE